MDEMQIKLLKLNFKIKINNILTMPSQEELDAIRTLAYAWHEKYPEKTSETLWQEFVDRQSKNWSEEEKKSLPTYKMAFDIAFLEVSGKINLVVFATF